MDKVYSWNTYTPGREKRPKKMKQLTDAQTGAKNIIIQPTKFVHRTRMDK